MCRARLERHLPQVLREVHRRAAGPRHKPGNVTGWFIHIEDGAVEVGHGLLAGADLVITADYETVVPLARTVFEGNPAGAEAAQQAVARATEQGKMKREGDEGAMANAPFLAGLHDALARRTA